jgi:hypothetical protein
MEGEHLGVSGGVVELLDPIPPLGDDHALIIEEDGSHRNFPVPGGFTGKVEGPSHVCFESH